jgi:DNA-binding MarR family transcriptional regulator
MRDPVALLCEDLQLTHPQVHGVLWLGYEGPLTMGVLARRAGISEKSITGVMDRLEAMGFVERVRTPGDRRAVSAQLTPAGHALHRQMDAHIDAGLGRVLALLEPSDQAALFGLLGRLAERMQAAHPPGALEHAR